MQEELMINKKRGSNEHVDVDYTLTQVPQHAQKHWLAIFIVLLGFTFLATTMAAGANIGTSFTFSELIILLLVGNVLLSTYVGLLCWVAAKTGLHTILLARYALGRLGSKWGSMILGGTQVFWYAVQAAYLGLLFTQGLGIEQYYIPITVFWSLVMGAAAIKGTKGMEIVAYLSIPPFLYLAYKIPALSIASAGGFGELFAIEPTSTMSFAVAITIIIGTFVSGGTQAPNWARFAKSPRTGFLVGFLAFFVGNTVMILAGMLGGLAIQEGDMIEIMIDMGIIVMGILILLFNIWTTNTATAYAFGVAGSEFFNKPNKVPFVIGGLIIATIMAATGIYAYFIDYLILLGVFIPPLGGLVIGDYLYTWRKSFPKFEHVQFRMVRYANLIAYLLATLAAYLSSVFEIGLPPLIGIVSAIILVYVINTIFKLFGIADSHRIFTQN